MIVGNSHVWLSDSLSLSSVVIIKLSQIKLNIISELSPWRFWRLFVSMYEVVLTRFWISPTSMFKDHLTRYRRLFIWMFKDYIRFWRMLISLFNGFLTRIWRLFISTFKCNLIRFWRLFKAHQPNALSRHHYHLQLSPPVQHSVMCQV